jgi:hypothetical protein
MPTPQLQMAMALLLATAHEKQTLLVHHTMQVPEQVQPAQQHQALSSLRLIT